MYLPGLCVRLTRGSTKSADGGARHRVAARTLGFQNRFSYGVTGGEQDEQHEGNGQIMPRKSPLSRPGQSEVKTSRPPIRRSQTSLGIRPVSGFCWKVKVSMEVTMTKNACKQHFAGSHAHILTCTGSHTEFELT